MPKKPARVLDTPNIKDNYYMNIVDCGKNNTLAMALGSKLVLWKSDTQMVDKLSQVDDDESDYPTSVSWMRNNRTSHLKTHTNGVRSLKCLDGLTVVSAKADKTLNLWEVFGPSTTNNSKLSQLDDFLSFRTYPIR
ncbi:hypothetical protein FNV43_RR09749 [Rhamnella rubrinervis]|uniref:Uncharacterized protein n=1 Tax=Rhamnella rubrinervis TaxID=2594499 RepID=A0A8K0HBT7_9ROSA|nr:hypothetical protein FNV43_RR09749 [Rhamnella rubrinervis]